MKRYGDLFEKVVDFKNLVRSCKQAAKGKKNKGYINDFLLFMEENLFQIREELTSEKYAWSGYYSFEIREPKPRLISAPVFRDRVAHHAVCKVIEPIFDQTFIGQNFACRKGKGTLAGVKQYEKYIYGHPELEYALKGDIQKYFPSVDHEILFRLIQKKIKDKKLLRLLQTLIFTGEGKGIPIGNLTSQLFANVYLNELDHFVKEKLQLKYYLRYMDDFLILHENKSFLKQLREQIKIFLSEHLRLTLHPHKQHISPVDQGINWLGYRIFRDYKRVRTQNTVNFRRRLKRLKWNYDNGKIDIRTVQSSIASWTGLSKHAEAFHLSRNIFSAMDIQNLGKYLLCSKK